MPATTTTLTGATLIPAGTTCVPGTPQRQTRYMAGKHGGVLTAKITNGASPPSAQCVCTIYISHDPSTTPPAAPGSGSPGEGADWKTWKVLGGGGVIANAILPMGDVIPPCRHLMIEFTGNTVQNVTVEAMITDYTDLQTT